MKAFYIALKKFTKKKSHHTIQNLDSSLNLEKICLSKSQGLRPKMPNKRLFVGQQITIQAFGVTVSSLNTSEDKVTRLFATLVYENYVVKFIIFLAFFVTI